jgi:hypothetical protein
VDRDRGAGLLSTSFGVLFFVGFLFFAVQLSFNLYATSVVTSTAYDAARTIATSSARATPPTQGELDAVVATARQRLGSYGRDAQFEWDLADSSIVRLHVHVENTRLVVPAIGFDEIDRTVVVRVVARS